MAQLLTLEWLARGTMFQLANGSEIGLAWRRPWGIGCAGKPAGWKKDQESGRNHARTRWL